MGHIHVDEDVATPVREEDAMEMVLFWMMREENLRQARRCERGGQCAPCTRTDLLEPHLTVCLLSPPRTSHLARHTHTYHLPTSSISSQFGNDGDIEAMDWTGGTRRRYANKGKGSNAVAQKQKAHFARARAAAQSQTPAIPEFMQTALASKRYQPPMTSSQHPGFNSHGRTPDRREKAPGSDRSSIRRSKHTDNDRQTYEADSGTSRKPPASKQERSLTSQELGFPATMTEEERLLLANRRRLLARSDWMGLAASRPAKFKFPSHRDKDRIGKRRKVEKSRVEQLRDPAPRPLSPVFQERHRPFEPLMSGALPQEEIDIKIGTDAFASQTQTIRPSVTPANTSMRPPSTVLSEESMLLDVDTDGFAVQTNERSFSPYYETSLRPPDTQDGVDAQDSWQAEETLLYASAERNNERGSKPAESDGFEHDFDQGVSQTELRSVLSDELRGEAGFNFPQVETDASTGVQLLTESQSIPERVRKLAQLPDDEEEEDDDDDDDDEEDTVFRKLNYLQEQDWTVKPGLPTEPSSMRVTQPSFFSALSQVLSESLATGRRRTEQISGPQGSDRASMASYDSFTDEMLDGDEKYTVLPKEHGETNSAMRPAPEPVDPQVEPPEPDESGDNDEEIWKTFILGDSKSEMSESTVRRQIWHESDAVSPLENQSTPRSTLEETHSDKATAGHSLAFDMLSSSHRADSTPSEHDSSGPSRRGLGTSMVGHAATAYQDNEEVEEPSGTALYSMTTGNIHAGSSSTANPKRFKKKREPQLPPVPKPSRFLPPAS